MQKARLLWAGASAGTNPKPPSESSSSTITGLKQGALLWYKIHVLLYGLCHISRDHASGARTLGTTDELYISGPYFTPEEATRIKATTINFVADNNEEVPPAILTTTDQIETQSTHPHQSTHLGTHTINIEESIQSRLSNFLDKRKASGDASSCGPHDLAPIYKSIFGISHTELVDKKFLSRLKRSGLDEKVRDGGTEKARKRKK